MTNSPPPSPPLTATTAPSGGDTEADNGRPDGYSGFDTGDPNSDGYSTFNNSNPDDNVWTFETNSDGEASDSNEDADDDFNNFQSATSAPPLSSASDGFGDSDDGFQSAPAPNEIADMILRGLNNDYSATTNAPQRRPPSPLFSPADPSSTADPTPRSVRDPLPIPPLNISRSKDGKPPVEIDSAAVTKAIANIRLKAPTLARNLDRGAMLASPSLSSSSPRPSPSILTLPPHPVIPPAPLSAFVNAATAKAIAATANLTRSATIAQALNLLDLAAKPGPLLLHIVGADFVECESKETVALFFDPIVRWLNHLSPRAIHLALVGPGVPAAMDGVKVALGTSNATASCHVGMYHDFLGTSPIPDLAVSFNSGVWGYSDWDDTVAFVSARRGGGKEAFFMIFTGYTVEECEDDYDKIAAIADKNKGNVCVWEPEANKYGSRKDREVKGENTATGGRVYRENAGWQCWSFSL